MSALGAPVCRCLPPLWLSSLVLQLILATLHSTFARSSVWRSQRLPTSRAAPRKTPEVGLGLLVTWNRAASSSCLSPKPRLINKFFQGNSTFWNLLISHFSLFFNTTNVSCSSRSKIWSCLSFNKFLVCALVWLWSAYTFHWMQGRVVLGESRELTHQWGLSLII